MINSGYKITMEGGCDAISNIMMQAFLGKELDRMHQLMNLIISIPEDAFNLNFANNQQMHQIVQQQLEMRHQASDPVAVRQTITNIQALFDSIAILQDSFAHLDVITGSQVLVLRSAPSDADKNRVLQSNDVLLVLDENKSNWRIGYNKNGTYEEAEIKNNFLQHALQKTDKIGARSVIIELNKVLTSLGSSTHFNTVQYGGRQDYQSIMPYVLPVTYETPEKKPELVIKLEQYLKNSYTRDSLKNSLSLLSSFLKEDFSLQISSHNKENPNGHTINLNYDSIKQQWLLANPNSLPGTTYDCSDYGQLLLANRIFECYEYAEQSPGFDINLFTTQEHSETIREQFANVEKQPGWIPSQESRHTLYDPLFNAVCLDKPSDVRRLLRQERLATSSHDDSLDPFGTAVCGKHKDIIQIFLEDRITSLQLKEKLMHHTELPEPRINQYLEKLTENMTDYLLKMPALKYTDVGKLSEIVRNKIIKDVKSEMSNPTTDIGKALRKTDQNNKGSWASWITSMVSNNTTQKFLDLKKSLNLALVLKW